MKFAFGPMSSEIIQAIYQYSHDNSVELMLIASKNQIDYDGGYVNNWNTSQYVTYLKAMKDVYKNSNILICRDHCGPGFKKQDYYELSDTYATIRDDIECEFDILHIDLCHYKYEPNTEDIIKGTLKCLEFARKINPNIQFEIGTDAIEDRSGNDIAKIKEELEAFKDFKPVYYVVKTGSLVKENYQAGLFNSHYDLAPIRDLCRNYDIKIKEHNSDYLTQDGIRRRQGSHYITDAMNIAPQLGVTQTMIVLTEATKYGVRFDNFVNLVYNNKKWVKWDDGNLKNNPWLATVVAGHYHYTSDEYKYLCEEIENQKCNLQSKIIRNVKEVVHHYVSAI